MTTTVTRELDLDHFDAAAQHALTVARGRCDAVRGNLLDSKMLLAGLADVAVAWPAGGSQQAIKDAPIGPATTEQAGEVAFSGVRLTREAEVTLQDALEVAAASDRRVSVLDVMAMLVESGGSEATQLMRAVTQERDPWVEVRGHLDRVEAVRRPQDAPETPSPQVAHPADTAYGRMVALVYLLIRDDVPAGRTIALVQELEQHSRAFKFTNPTLAKLATELVDRLWR